MCTVEGEHLYTKGGVLCESFSFVYANQPPEPMSVFAFTLESADPFN